MLTKTISRFLDPEGRVRQWPAKRGDQAKVVAYLAARFEVGGYTEPEVNDRLKEWHTFGDWVLLRRELYEQGYLDRTRDGLTYTRTKKSVDEIPLFDQLRS